MNYMNTYKNITFVTGIFNVYEKDYDTANKTIEKRIEHFEKIASLGLCISVFTDDVYIDLINPLKTKYSNIRVYNVGNYWMSETGRILKEYEKKTEKEIELPKIRNILKDTKEFLLLINTKIELVKKAININIFDSNYFMWFDFGIAYIFKDTQNTLKYIQSIEQMNFVEKFVYIPGCWDEKIMRNSGLWNSPNSSNFVQNRFDFNIYVKEKIMWRFCGGIILGDKQSLINFYNVCVGSQWEFYNTYNTIVWEANYWAWIEKCKNFQIQWGYADHDDGIFKIPEKLLKINIRTPPDCTLTTCCFDLTKYNSKSRNFSELLKNMTSLLETPCFLVIYTDNISFEEISKIRKPYESITHYVIMNPEDLDVFKYIDMVIENRKKYHPTKDELTNPQSHLISCSKFELVLKTINANPFNTSKFGWIDANIGVKFSKICSGYKQGMLEKVLEKCSPNKFNLQILNVCDKKFIREENLREYYSQYRWNVCGCLFVVGKELGIQMLNELNSIFIKHTELGYGHSEEMFYLEILDKHSDKINKSYGDYNDILNNFINITNNIPYVYMIASKYLNMGYNVECAECCNKMFNSWENKIINIDYEYYFKFLFLSYIANYYVCRERSLEIAKKIKYLIQTNADCEKVYLKNKDYYDNQLSYVNL